MVVPVDAIRSTGGGLSHGHAERSTVVTSCARVGKLGRNRRRALVTAIAGLSIVPLAWALPLVRTANASASIGPAQSFGAANTVVSTSLTATTTTATGAGDLLVATIRTRLSGAPALVSAITDSSGSNTWARATQKVQGSQADGEIWYATDAAAVTTVTVTAGSTAAAIAFTIIDVAGAATTAPLDVVATNGGTSPPVTSGATTSISQPSEIVVADIGWNLATITPSGQTAGYTLSAIEQSTASNAAGEQAAWNLASPSGPQSYGVTLSSSTATWTGAIAAFLVATGPPPPPTITNFTPTSGPVGTSVVITGTGFTGTTVVDFFNSQSATYHVDSDTQITTTVPSGAATGPIQVTAPGGSVTSTTNFTVTTSPPPTITSFTPSSGPLGTSVVITGTGFTGTTVVDFFNSQSATYHVDSDTQITTTVPSGAATGPINVTTPGGSVTSTTNFTVTTSAGPPHVMVVVMENQEYSSIIGSSNAPYINSLAKTYRSATNWFAVQHNSPHDYLDLIAGSDLGLPNGVPYSAKTVVDELHSASVPWKGYMESMPSSCYTGSSTPDGLYDPIHNPFHYFTNYTTSSGGWCSSGNASTEGVLPYTGSGGLVSTLTGANPPAYVWISPNDCDNMHGDTSTGSPCKRSSNGQLIKAGDTWLSTNLGAVISSSWFTNNGTIILTWDEGTSSKGCCGLGAPGGHIVTLVIASNNKGGGKYTPNGDHFGTLRGIQEAYGVTPLLGGAAKSVNGDLKNAF